MTNSDISISTIREGAAISTEGSAFARRARRAGRRQDDKLRRFGRFRSLTHGSPANPPAPALRAAQTRSHMNAGAL